MLSDALNVTLLNSFKSLSIVEYLVICWHTISLGSDRIILFSIFWALSVCDILGCTYAQVLVFVETFVQLTSKSTHASISCFAL